MSHSVWKLYQSYVYESIGTKTYWFFSPGGSDFVPVDTTLTFGPSVTRATHTIIFLDDEISEGLENFEVQLVLVNPALGVPGVITTTSVVILDNEGIVYEGVGCVRVNDVWGCLMCEGVWCVRVCDVWGCIWCVRVYMMCEGVWCVRVFDVWGYLMCEDVWCVRVCHMYDSVYIPPQIYLWHCLVWNTSSMRGVVLSS